MSRSKPAYSDHLFASKETMEFEQMLHESKYLDIWDNNPSFIDINIIYSSIKGLSVLVVAIFFMIATYLIISNPMIGVLLGVATMIFFMVAFSDTIFGLRGGFSTLFSKYRNVNMFSDFTFFL